MIPAFSIRALWRWLLAAGAVVAAFFATFYFGLLLLLFGMFPKTLAELFVGFMMGLLVVLIGSLAAPRYPLGTALTLFAAMMVLAGIFSTFGTFGTLTSGTIALRAIVIAWKTGYSARLRRFRRDATDSMAPQARPGLPEADERPRKAGIFTSSLESVRAHAVYE